MGAAAHVGRIGALAVALGVSAAVATGPGVAWAETGSTSGGSSSSAGGSSSSGASSGSSTTSTKSGSTRTSSAGNSGSGTDDSGGGTRSRTNRDSSDTDSRTGKETGKETGKDTGKDTGEDSKDTGKDKDTEKDTGSGIKKDAGTDTDDTDDTADASPSDGSDKNEDAGDSGDASETPSESSPETSPGTSPETGGGDTPATGGTTPEDTTPGTTPDTSQDATTPDATDTEDPGPAPAEAPRTGRGQSGSAAKDTAAVDTAAEETAGRDAGVTETDPDPTDNKSDSKTAATTTTVSFTPMSATSTVAATAPATSPDSSPDGSAGAGPDTTAITPTAAEATRAHPIRTLVSGLLAAVGISPLAAGTPATPAHPPLLWTVLAWARREFERITGVQTTQATTPVTGTSLLTAQAGTADAAEAAQVVLPDLPSSLTSAPVGWVTGQNNNAFPGLFWKQTNNTAGFGIYGTDLGIMWDGGIWNGKPFVHTAYGDTFSGPNMTGDWRSNVLLISTDTNLSNGLSLEQTGYAYQFIPSNRGALSWFTREVTVIPTAGIQIDGKQYVNYMSVRQWGNPGSWSTNYSGIAVYNPDTDKWSLANSTIRSAGLFRSSKPYVWGSNNFQMGAFVLPPEGSAQADDGWLYSYGTPAGRSGTIYVSRVQQDEILNLSKYQYWNGSDWVSNRPSSAEPILPGTTKSSFFGLFKRTVYPSAGELSVQYNQYLDKYLMTYTDGGNNVVMRLSDSPESGWSDPITLATSLQYPGLYAPMIHPWSGTGKLTDSSGDGDYSTLYWNMSLWGNYNVALMETDLSGLQTILV
ncbi:DUF4185 domain-containing protein [Mycolicibacterium palauense]|uniref:DUF4185 domain-containing protein n=1 Tax=Mycolicibacterium palauense TaxID=2034511 RepID=UPI001FE28085|nr:DUF4185 domain-containing protein [Mycolicibacterium palauense]